MTARVLRSTRLGVIGIAAIVAVPWAVAQTVKTFDVISIKPDKDSHGLDAGTQPGGRYTARNVPAQFLVTEAFGVKDFQIVGAPKWLNDERYDIAAKANTPVQLSQDQLRPLLQALLVDRFKLKFHTEMKAFPAYALVVGKNGPKFEADNSILTSMSFSISSSKGRATVAGRKISMSAFATHLTDMAGRTVIDDTGLKGDFDVKLNWTPSEAADDVLPTIFVAVQEQLGLKLNPVKKAPVQVIVIESIEKPSAN
jgi:uncharacterized protein (TIGR03435 family)